MLSGVGGVERYVLNLSAFTENPRDRYGYIILGDNTVYEKELTTYGVDYFFITHKDVSITKNIRETKKLFKELRTEYDTIYFNTSGLFYPIPYIIAHHEGYKIVLHSHLHLHLHLHIKPTEVIRYFIHYFNRFWINKLVAQRLACSTPAAKWMFGRLADTAKLVPNAIDLEKFRFREDVRKERRAELKLSDDTILLGNVGRLTPFKNQCFLLKILAACKERDSHVKLLLVGNGEDQQTLKTVADQLGVIDHVIFYGKSDMPQELMCAMDCIVMPSLREGFPITLVEAQAFGLPCFVSTEITEEVNISGNIQFISLEESAEKWADMIMKEPPQRYDCIDLLREKGYDVRHLETTVYKLLKEDNSK